MLEFSKPTLPQGHSSEQVCTFGKRALTIFITNGNTYIGKAFSYFYIGFQKYGTRCDLNHNSSLYIAFVCNLLASACLSLKRYNESLSYLNWANRNLIKLSEDGSCGNSCVFYALIVNQKELCRCKAVIGRYEEALIHLRKQLEIQEKIVGEGCINLCEDYVYVSTAYYLFMNYEEALFFYLKALEIYVKRFGLNSVVVAKMRRHLAVIYNELGQYEKALEQIQLSLTILKKTTPDSPVLLEAECNYGNILIGLGRYEEAIDVLKGVALHTETVESVKGFAYVNLAKAFCYLEKFPDAKKHMRTAQRIFEKKEMGPRSVAIGFVDMSKLYEKMNDFGKAMSLLQRALSNPKVPLKLIAEGSERLFSLISLAGMEKEGIPYMEDMVEKLKENFGPDRREVAHGYKNLGAAYLKSGQEELALKFVVKAKAIMDVALGPSHLDSLKTSQALAETYATLGSYDLAMEIQQKVVEGFTGLWPSEQEKLDEAVGLLEKMKDAIGAESESCTAKDLKCSVS